MGCFGGGRNVRRPSDSNIFTGATIYPNLIAHNVTQPMSFLALNFMDTTTGGFDSYDMMEPSKWWLHQACGVKFHNGAAWNAEAAKFSIDFLGDTEIGTQTFSNVRRSHAEVVDDLTVGFIRDDVPYPFLTRFSMFHVYQATEWYQSVSDEARDEVGGDHRLGLVQIQGMEPGRIQYHRTLR